MSSATPNNPYDALASEVLPGLYIASSRVARNEQLLCDLGITLIVNCAFECPNHLESTGKFDYVNCYLTDEPDELLWPTYEANGVGRRIGSFGLRFFGPHWHALYCSKCVTLIFPAKSFLFVLLSAVRFGKGPC
jgi:hypothetical protein